MKLYDSLYSHNSKRVRVCAAELGIELEHVVLETLRADRDPEYLELHPMGLVPTLVDDEGFALWESQAILFYLASRDAQNRLLPPGHRPQADALRWMFWTSNSLGPTAAPVLIERIVKPEALGQPPDEETVARGLEGLAPLLSVLDGQLEARTWVLGDAFSIVDIALGTELEMLNKAQVDLTEYSNLVSWFERLRARPTWDC